MSAAPAAPTFTVLVPTHQRAALLPRAVASVLAQSFGDFELLVVDDASTDATGEVIAGLDDPRIRYVRRESNGGAAATRNHGIRLARGHYIALLDDDDELLPTFLERTLAVWHDAPAAVGLTWSGVRWVRDGPAGVTLLREELWQPSFSDREAAYRGFLRSRRIGTNCGLTFRPEVFAEVGGFDETFTGGAEDTDLLIRVVRRFDYRVVPEVLVELHLHAGPNLRRAGAAKAADYERIVAKHRDTLAAHPRLAAELYYKTGWLHGHGGDRRRGRSFLLRSLRARPWRLKSWLMLLFLGVLGPAAPAVHRLASRLASGRASLSHAASRES